MSAVTQAYVMLDGIKMLATYSEDTGLWTAQGSAPAESSWGEPDHVFTATIHAIDAAGEVEASGQCEISQVSDSEVTLTALIQPMAKSATYVLEYTYEIPPEVLIHDIRVAVS